MLWYYLSELNKELRTERFRVIEENNFLSMIKDAYLSSENNQETSIPSLENDLHEALNQLSEESNNDPK